MALFRVVVRKAINNSSLKVRWSNRYFVEASSAATAAAQGIVIWDSAERLFHKSQVFCYEAYATDLLESTVNYAIVPHADNGTSYGALDGSGELLPLFNVVRYDFPVNAPSRPSRKFFRLPLAEQDQNGGTITGSTLLNALAMGMEFLVDNTAVKDESGNGITGAVNRGITSKRLGNSAYINIPAAPVGSS